MIDRAVIKEASRLCLALYGYVDAPIAPWDHLDTGAGGDKVCWAVRKTDEIDYVVLRGSATTTDWIRDFNAWSPPWPQDGLGHVHPGFLLGMDQVRHELAPWLSQKIVVTGHSLGAARADILTGLLLKNGYEVDARVVFGEPKPGFADFAALIAGVPAVSYCCGDDRGHDLVTDVPFSFPPENYVHPAALTSVSGSPSNDDKWGPFRYHHFQLYDAAVQAMTA